MTRHCILAIALLAACGSDGGSGDDDPLGGSLTVSGQVVDFQTRTAIAGSVSVATTGITPPPMISSEGASYTITQIPENSLFQVLASAPPTHIATFSPVIEVTTSDRSGVDVPAVKSDYLAALTTAFNVTPSATRGVLFVRVVDAAGAPKSGVMGFAFAGGTDQRGPFFLDANMMAAPTATSTSASGWVVLFEVAPGTVSVGTTAGPNTIDMPIQPIAAATVTIADAKATTGATQTPTNVSFRMHVMPIWNKRGCPACHIGGAPGNGLGNLRLDGTEPNPIYDELIKERPNTRVMLGNPEASLILTKPLYESPPNHQNGTFPSKQDPDYLTILGWIKEGANNN